MKFIKEPENGIWVAVQDKLAGSDIKEAKENLKEMVSTRQVWFADLDDCDADSPAKKIAMQRIGTSLYTPSFIGWVMNYGLPAKFDKNKESLAWEKYVETFLRDEKTLSQIKEMFNQEEVINSLYPGVGEFYSLMFADKYYLTRNIKEVAEAYGEVLGFKGIFPETHDKKDLVEGFILNNPQIWNYGLSGDSIEDRIVADVLKFYHNREEIALPLTLYRADSPEELNLDFDINIGKDRTGLVEILKS